MTTASKQSKAQSDRNARILLDIVKEDGNTICADCARANPRWSSSNLGCFICQSCAAIHRGLGTHISKVKSLNLDLWTSQQVDVMRSIGNVKSNQLYNPSSVAAPSSEDTTAMTKFIRNKYEYKKFMQPSERKVEVPTLPSRPESSANSGTSPLLPRRPQSSQQSSFSGPPLPPRSNSSASVPQQPSSVWDDLINMSDEPTTMQQPVQPMSMNSLPPIQHAYQVPLLTPAITTPSFQNFPATNPFFAIIQQQQPPLSPSFVSTNPFNSMQYQQQPPLQQQFMAQQNNQAYGYQQQQQQQYWNM